MKMGLLHNSISRLCCHVNWYKKKPMQFQNKQTEGCWKIDCLLVVWPLFQGLRKYPWRTHDYFAFKGWTSIRLLIVALKRNKFDGKDFPNILGPKIEVWLYDSHLWFTTFEAFLSKNKVQASSGVSILQKAKKGPEGVDDYKKAPSGKLVVALDSSEQSSFDFKKMKEGMHFEKKQN